MCAGVANFLNLEKLSQELVSHCSDYLVEEQVLIDRVQATLGCNRSCLDSLAHDPNVLARVLNVLKLHPILLVELRRVQLVISGLHRTHNRADRVCNELAEVVLSLVFQVYIVFKFFRDAVLNLLMELRYNLEAILAGVHDVDQSLLLILCQENGVCILLLFEGPWRQLCLQELDVVLEDAFEGTL